MADWSVPAVLDRARDPDELEELDFEDGFFDELCAAARAQHRHSAVRRDIVERTDDRFIAVLTLMP